MARTTIKDIARIAALSQATVSLALRNDRRISAETKSRVLKIARETGYIYNRQAANFRMNRSRTVAVCLNTMENPIVAHVFTSLLRVFQPEGWMVLFGDTEDSADKQKDFITSVMEHNIDGIVVIPAVGTDAGELADLARQVPIVLALRAVPGSQLDQVRIDYRGGVEQAVDHLVGQGHRRIAWMGGGLATETSRVGLDGFRDRLAHHRIQLQPTWIHRCLTSRRNGAEAMRALRAGAPELSAVLCFSDLLAAGALKQLAEDGVVPGRDMSVVGFDDLEEASYLLPPLTTVRLDQALLGESAARLLLDRINDPAMPQKVMTIAAELVVRGTTGRNGRPGIAPP